jgi:hypothetical protein
LDSEHSDRVLTAASELQLAAAAADDRDKCVESGGCAMDICRSSPCILVRSDLPWARGALDHFCFISELCVAQSMWSILMYKSRFMCVYICCWKQYI